MLASTEPTFDKAGPQGQSILGDEIQGRQHFDAVGGLD